MNVNLPLEQKNWIEAGIKAGTFASVDDALSRAVATLMAYDDEDSLEWAIPLLDEARASLGRGEGISLDEFRVKIAKRLAETE